MHTGRWEGKGWLVNECQVTIQTPNFTSSLEHSLMQGQMHFITDLRLLSVNKENPSAARLALISAHFGDLRNDLASSVAEHHRTYG